MGMETMGKCKEHAKEDNVKINEKGQMETKIYQQQVENICDGE